MDAEAGGIDTLYYCLGIIMCMCLSSDPVDGTVPPTQPWAGAENGGGRGRQRNSGSGGRGRGVCALGNTRAARAPLEGGERERVRPRANEKRYITDVYTGRDAQAREAAVQCGGKAVRLPATRRGDKARAHRRL